MAVDGREFQDINYGYVLELYEKFKPWIEGDGTASQQPDLAIDD